MPSRTASRTFGSLRPALTDSTSICRTCAHTLRRQYASAATAVAESAGAPVESLAPQGAYKMCAGVVLSRPPQITRDLHPFEKAFFLYQRRLNERLSLPFTRYFYYRKKTPSMQDFQKKIKARTTPARDIGEYNAYSKDAWNDEVVLGNVAGEPEVQKEALLKDEKPFSEDDDPAKALQEHTQQRPLSRVTEADEKNDVKSLNRALQKTLYLLVQDSKGKWRFPQARIEMEKSETLRNAANRILETTAGTHMNTWIVGNHPIAHVEEKLNVAPKTSGEDAKTPEEIGDIVFLMKGRIMAGQANIEKNIYGVKDYKWLTREEIHKAVTQNYWSAIEKVLPEQ